MGTKVRVYPHPRLAETNEYLPGIGVDGAEVSETEAARLEKNDLIVRQKPAAPKATPKPKKSKTEPNPPETPPAQPAPEPEVN